MNLAPFSIPDAGGSIEAEASTTSANYLIPGTGTQIYCANSTNQGCFVAVGNISIEATDTCIFVPGNGSRVFTIPPAASHVAVLTPTGTTSLFIARGVGF